MITISPCRSAKWAGRSSKPLSARRSIADTRTSAPADHSTQSAQPVNHPAASTSSAQPRLNGRIAQIARAEPLDWAKVNIPAWIRTRPRYAAPKMTPSWPNASGTATAITRNAAMPSRTNSRRMVDAIDTLLVSQANPSYIHHRTTRISAGPSQVGRAVAVPDHAGELGDGEDEDQVEEQLQRGDAAGLAQGRCGAPAAGWPFIGQASWESVLRRSSASMIR